MYSVQQINLPSISQRNVGCVFQSQKFKLGPCLFFTAHDSFLCFWALASVAFALFPNMHLFLFPRGLCTWPSLCLVQCCLCLLRAVFLPSTLRMIYLQGAYHSSHLSLLLFSSYLVTIWWTLSLPEDCKLCKTRVASLLCILFRTPHLAGTV